MSLPDLHHPQTLGKTQDDLEHEGHKHLHTKRTFPYGNSGHHSSGNQSIGCGHFGRSERCLLSHTDPPFFKGSSRFRLSRRNFPVQGPSIRPETGSSSFYSSSLCPSRLPQVSRSETLHLPGRLALGGELCVCPSVPHGPPTPYHTEIGVHSQLGQVGVDSLPQAHLSGRGNRHREPTCPPQPGQGSSDCLSSSISSSFTSSSSRPMAPVPGPFIEPCRCPPRLSSSVEAFPTSSSEVFQAQCGLSQGVDSSNRGNQTPSYPLVERVFPSSRQTSSQASSVDLHLDGCLPSGLGRPLSEPGGIGGLVTSVHLTPHQCLRVDGSFQVSPTLREHDCRAIRFDPHGQHYGCRLHQQTGRNSFQNVERFNRQALEVVSSTPNLPDSFLCSRPGESHCRLPVPGHVPSFRMDSEPRGLRSSQFSVVASRDRSLCDISQSSPPEILLSSARSGSLGSRCILPPLGEFSRLRLSADILDSSNPEENPGRSGVDPSHSTLLAEETVVSSSSLSPGRSTTLPSEESRPHCSAPVGGPPSSSSGSSFNRLAFVGEDARTAGLSERASQFIVQSRRESTRAVYNSRLEAFFAWCEEKGISPRSSSVGAIADFLISLFDKGRSLSTIRGYRSAIAAVHLGFSDGSGVSNSPFLTHLLRSFFLKRPANRSLTPSWSLPLVLDALAKPPFEPMSKASLHHLSIKTAFLIAIASGQRRSTIQALSTAPGHIRWENHGVRLVPRPSFIAKNQTDSSGAIEVFLSPLSEFSSVKEDKTWCPVRALKWYLDKTRVFRKDDQLFLISRHPFSPASRETVSRWIVEAIQAAGSEALLSENPPKAHDTRSVSTSWALFQGVPLEDILRAAFWRSPNSFTSFYLKDVPSGEVRFASSGLRAASSSLPAPR